MQSRKATKILVWVLLTIVLGQSGYIYLSSPSQPTPSRLLNVTPLGETGAVYEILYDSGGATVPFVYRYFLMERGKNESEALEFARRNNPVLVTKSPNAVQGVSSDKVHFVTTDTVYKFISIGYYQSGESENIVKLELSSSMP